MFYIESNHLTIGFALVLAAAVIAAIFDVRTRRIPNALVIALFAAGLAVNALAGWQFAAIDAIVAIAVLIAGTAAFALKLIGGGDIKLLAAAAGTLGFPAAAWFVLFTFVCGGLIAVLYSAARGTLGATAANVRGLVLPMAAGIRPMRLTNGTSMPYALAICAGALLALVTGGSVPHLRF